MILLWLLVMNEMMEQPIKPLGEGGPMLSCLDLHYRESLLLPGPQEAMTGRRASKADSLSPWAVISFCFMGSVSIFGPVTWLPNYAHIAWTLLGIQSTVTVIHNMRCAKVQLQLLLTAYT
jgi:hypothetical protein